jgi:hypothetical protein
MLWIKDRLKERTSLDGILMVAAGLALLFLPVTVVKLVAIGAVAYGAYTLLMKG